MSYESPHFGGAARNITFGNQIDSNNNVNTLIKKNAISFDIDFNNIQENVQANIKKKNLKDVPKQPEVIPNVEDPEEAKKEQTLYQCPNCSRKFKREAYAKHVPICERVFHEKKENTTENNKANDIFGKNDIKNNKNNFNKKAKWENQSNELRAIIQSKRAEKENDHINNKQNPLKIEVEEPKNKIGVVVMKNNNSNAMNNFNRQAFTQNNMYIQCDLCNKKFTKINYESHLPECKQKNRDRKSNLTFNKPSFEPAFNMNNALNNSPVHRQPLMPAVTYGGFSNKPNLNLKFGKH